MSTEKQTTTPTAAAAVVQVRITARKLSIGNFTAACGAIVNLQKETAAALIASGEAVKHVEI